MNKKAFRAAVLLLMMMTLLCGCGGKKDDAKTAEAKIAGSVSNDALINTTEPDLPEAAGGTAEKLSEEQALSAIRSYCYTMNPDLENIVKNEEYPVYWNISSSDENEIVVLFRSYTGAQNRYYIDRNTGDTYVTEFVPGITDEEQWSEESFNVRDYIIPLS
ncbi:MAG: hypothetical protein Q4F31_10130 [Eubacteriales bacterium]|nr:hypothetical protein [Eubacteriales bacterium]